jgi:hypothetical protein
VPPAPSGRWNRACGQSGVCERLVHLDMSLGLALMWAQVLRCVRLDRMVKGIDIRASHHNHLDLRPAEHLRSSDAAPQDRGLRRLPGLHAGRSEAHAPQIALVKVHAGSAVPRAQPFSRKGRVYGSMPVTSIFRVMSAMLCACVR